MTNNHSAHSVKMFDKHAQAFSDRFMDLASYDKHIEYFCSLMLNEKPTLLELGCGPGNITRRIQTCCPRADIVAVDLAEEMIAIARKNISNVDFRIMDVRHIDQCTQSFDAIAASFVLPFLTYDESRRLFDSMFNLLKTPGYVYLSTMEGTKENNGFEKTSFSGADTIHFTYYEVPFLLEALSASGFSVKSVVRQPYYQNDIPILTDIILVCQK
jgi:cyclopropane fatty-acyl-phospholipid synthase-like methyltransferase